MGSATKEVRDMVPLHAEVALCNPDCEVRLGHSSWDYGDISIKYAYWTNGRLQRGGEFPVEALDQMIELAHKHGYPTSPGGGGPVPPPTVVAAPAPPRDPVAMVVDAIDRLAVTIEAALDRVAVSVSASIMDATPK